MKLSVILPCYNGADTIAVQLEALTRQEWPGGWEMIVVNNGSTDRSMDIVEQYRDRLPDLKIVQAHVPGTTRLGVPHSYNTGVQAATGDAFALCEADDEVAPGWLLAIGTALADHDFVAARLEHRKLNPTWLHPPYGEGEQGTELRREPAPPHFFLVSLNGVGLRRSLYEKVGPFSIDFPIAHDTDYSWRMQLAGYSLHFEPDAVVHYRERLRLHARYRQGRNWGRDTTRVMEYYGVSRPRFAVSRQLVSIGRSLPAGAWASLLWALRLPTGLPALSEWIWDAGWQIGTLSAYRETAAAPRRGAPAVATPRSEDAAAEPVDGEAAVG
jgi:glycosyltransferase involved in cell wall biosynthesis